MVTNITRAFIVTVSILAASALAHAQPLLNWSADDGTRVETLAKKGSRIEGDHMILWFPASLSQADAEVIVKRIDPAVEGLWRRVGIHNWQAVRKGKITFYLSDDMFVAHASGRSAVFLPMARVKDGRAPFLHEATHELLASTNRDVASRPNGQEPVRRPLWLVEGLPEYIARLVAEERGIIEEGPFGIPSISGVDRICAERAATPDGATMLPFVGGADRPEVLFTTDRVRFAPTFYACSFSFTKYLAGRVGLETLIGILALKPSEIVARLDRLADRPLADLRSEWLRLLKLP